MSVATIVAEGDRACHPGRRPSPPALTAWRPTAQAKASALAAVIGLRFGHWPCSPRWDVEPALDHLVKAELIGQVGRRPAGAEYVFYHPLIRAVGLRIAAEIGSPPSCNRRLASVIQAREPHLGRRERSVDSRATCRPRVTSPERMGGTCVPPRGWPTGIWLARAQSWERGARNAPTRYRYMTHTAPRCASRREVMFVYQRLSVCKRPTTDTPVRGTSAVVCAAADDKASLAFRYGRHAAGTRTARSRAARPSQLASEYMTLAGVDRRSDTHRLARLRRAGDQVGDRSRSPTHCDGPRIPSTCPRATRYSNPWRQRAFSVARLGPLGSGQHRVGGTTSTRQSPWPAETDPMVHGPRGERGTYSANRGGKWFAGPTTRPWANIDEALRVRRAIQ